MTKLEARELAALAAATHTVTKCKPGRKPKAPVAFASKLQGSITMHHRGQRHNFITVGRMK